MEKSMLSKLLASRWKHVIRLLPMGALIGLVFGLVFNDVAYGLLAGCVMGGLLGLLLVVRNPS